MRDWGNVILEPHFPITSFTPKSKCPHNGAYRRGSQFCCMVCHKSGRDHRVLPGVPVGSQLNKDWKPPKEKVAATPTVYNPPKKEKPMNRDARRAAERAGIKVCEVCKGFEAVTKDGKLCRKCLRKWAESQSPMPASGRSEMVGRKVWAGPHVVAMMGDSTLD